MLYNWEHNRNSVKYKFYMWAIREYITVYRLVFEPVHTINLVYPQPYTLNLHVTHCSWIICHRATNGCIVVTVLYCIVFLIRFHKIQYMSVKTFGCRTSHVITTIQNLYMIKSVYNRMNEITIILYMRF